MNIKYEKQNTGNRLLDKTNTKEHSSVLRFRKNKQSEN